MSHRIWELHSMRLKGVISTTPEGEADIAGLVLSEKAYLIAVRDFRPAQLAEMVQREGALRAADHLVAHYSSPEAAQVNAGRTLVLTRGAMSPYVLRRSDEVAEAAPIGFR